MQEIPYDFIVFPFVCKGWGHPLGFTSVVVMHFAQDFDAFPLGLHMVPSVFCKGPHTVGFTSMVCIHFARGTPPRFPLSSLAL